MQIVIIGAGYAGLMCTLRLAGKIDRSSTQITLINDSDMFTERIRMHELAAGHSPKKHRIADILRQQPVELVQGQVTAIVPVNQQLTINTTTTIRYDLLVYAIGSHVNIKAIPGLREYAFTLDAHSAEKLAETIPPVASRDGKLVVIGGGLTGIESASELAARYPHLQVELLTDGQTGSGLSNKGRAYIQLVFKHTGITLHEYTRVTEIDASYIHLADGTNIPYDICIWAGAFKVPELASRAGLKVNSVGQVITDSYLRSVSHPEIYAVGDAASIIPYGHEKPLRMACATAMPSGTHAADNILARLQNHSEKPFGFHYMIQCISLGRKKGLVQWVTPRDTPRKRIITHRFGAWIKEFICRFTVWSLYLESRFPGFYRWPGRRIKTDSSHQKQDTTHEYI